MSIFNHHPDKDQYQQTKIEGFMTSDACIYTFIGLAVVWMIFACSCM